MERRAERAGRADSTLQEGREGMYGWTALVTGERGDA